MEQKLNRFFCSISHTGHGLLDSSQSTQSEIKQKLSLTSNYSGRSKKHNGLFGSIATVAITTRLHTYFARVDLDINIL